MLRHVAVRLLWTVFAAYLVLSGTFFLFALTPDPNEALVAFGAGQNAEDPEAAVEEATSAYREARDRDRPLLDRYVDWMVGYATLDWGTSYPFLADREPKPVTTVIADTGAVTLLYLLPALLLAILGGTFVGLYSAVRPNTVLDYLGTTVSYLGLGLPSFWAAEAAALLAITELQLYSAGSWKGSAAPLSGDNWPLMAIAGGIVATNLLAVQVRYTRAESKEYVPAAFVKMLRSTGASETTVARHVLRNAAMPLVSLLFSEVLVMLLITVYVVETILGVPGVGQAAFQAMQDRDVGLVLGTTLLVILLTLLGNLLQDVTYVYLDPRIDHGER